MCYSKPTPECLLNQHNEDRLSHIFSSVEIDQGAVVLSKTLIKAWKLNSKDLCAPLLEGVCVCSKHRLPGPGPTFTGHRTLQLSAYPITLHSDGVRKFRDLLNCHQTKRSDLNIRSLVKGGLTIVDNLLVALEVYHRKIKAGTLNDSLMGSFLYWMFLYLGGTWVKELKYHLNWNFIDAERRTGEDRLEYPERDVVILGKNGKLAVGLIQKLYNVLLRTKVNRERNRSFRNTVLQGIKRGMPTVDRQFVIDTAWKHSRVLSKQEETPSEILEYMEEEIYKMIPEYKENFGDIGSTISHHSCSENNLKDLGALSYCQRLVDESESEDHYNVQYRNFRTDPLWELCPEKRDTPLVDYHDFINSNSGPEEPNLKDYLNTHYLLTKTIGFDNLYRMWYHPCYGVLEDRYRFSFNTTKEICHNISLEPEFEYDKTFVKFILEPLKCRTITKAPALVNGIYKDLQQFLWKTLRRSPQFKLIGETVTPEHITDLWAETSYCFPEEEDDESFYWVSGDYSAATDNMHMDVTDTLLTAIMRNDHVYRHVMKRALIGNEISYHNCFKGLKDKELPPDFRQTNGQLMGCVFSFILLCLANYLIYRYTLKQVYGVNSLIYQRAPVLTNGDDILFRAKPEFIDAWTKNISKVGFSKSVGKNFEAKNFCTINSVYFLPKQGRSVTYLNHGFIYDMKKGDSDMALMGLEESVNGKLYTLGFKDYYQYWNAGPMSKYRGKVLEVLFDHRKDIGWSGRNRYSLGLAEINDLAPWEELFNDRIASQKTAGLIGHSKQVQSSNSMYGLIARSEITCIKKLKAECYLANPSRMSYARDKLLHTQKSQAEERIINNQNPMIGQGFFYEAVPVKGFRIKSYKSLRSIDENSDLDFVECLAQRIEWDRIQLLY